MARPRPGCVGLFCLLVAAGLTACTFDDGAVPRNVLDDLSSPSDGLVVMRYSIAADAPNIEAVAVAFAHREFPSPAGRDRLAHSGLQAVIVPTSDLPTIRSRLGSVTELTQTQIGQSAHWIELARRDMPGDQILSMGGRTQHFRKASFRLSVRDWLVPDQEGGCVQTEVLVHWVAENEKSSPIAGDPPVGTPLLLTAIECCLRSGETLLLLPSPPSCAGKGPAVGADMPPSPGNFLLGEPLSDQTTRVTPGYSMVVALAATVPEAMTPQSAETVDTTPSIVDTAPSAVPSP